MRRIAPPTGVERELGYYLRLEPDPTLALDEDSGRSMRVARLSPADLSLLSDSPDRYAVGDRHRLRVHPDIPALETVISDIRPRGDDGDLVEVRGRFQAIERRSGIELHALLHRLRSRGAAQMADSGMREVDRIVDGARIRAIVHALFANRSEGYLRASGAPPIRVRAARLEPEHPQPLHLDLQGPWPEGAFSVELCGYNSVFRFRVDGGTGTDGFLAVAVPTEILRTRRQWHRRVPAPREIEVSFPHPQWPEVGIRRAVRDVSIDGIGFATSAWNDLLYPGLVVERVVIEWEERLRLEFRGVVCHVSTEIGGAAEVAGMRLEPLSPDDRARWHIELDRLLYPHTRIDGSWSRELWDLYDRAGYFNLSGKSSADFEHLRVPFAETSRKVALAPKLGCQTVWPSRRGAEAAMSLLKVYQSSTLAFQLARQHGRTPLWSAGRQILRDVYLHAIEHTGRDASLKWMIAWLQENARFSRLSNYELPRRYVDDGRAYIHRFRAFGGSCATALAPLPVGVTVARAEPRDKERLLGVLAATCATAFLEAHDLVPEHLDLARLTAEWAAAGLTREREILVARRGGDALAAAVVEYAADGLHLFNLLDVVRLYSLEAGGEELLTPLLEGARAWYAARGKRNFVYFHERGTVDHAVKAGLEDLGAADLTLLPVELLPELLEHIHEITAPRDVPALKVPVTSDEKGGDRTKPTP